jgi:hypothetical protein
VNRREDRRRTKEGGMIYTVTEESYHHDVYLIEAPSKAAAKRIVAHQSVTEDAERLIQDYNFRPGHLRFYVDGAFLTKEDALFSIAPKRVDQEKARRVPKKTRGASRKEGGR